MAQYQSLERVYISTSGANGLIKLRIFLTKYSVPQSIVKNVYRELVRREAINAFDPHQGQESAHNVKIYWQVIEYIKKTTSNCSWEEADMLCEFFVVIGRVLDLGGFQWKTEMFCFRLVNMLRCRYHDHDT